jgi:hypothetical protein
MGLWIRGEEGGPRIQNNQVLTVALKSTFDLKV